MQFALISMEIKIPGIFANKAVKEKFLNDAIIRLCTFKFLKSDIEYLAQHLQRAKRAKKKT